MKTIRNLTVLFIILIIGVVIEVDAQTVSLKYKPDYITGFGNTGVIKVITPKVNDRKFNRKKKSSEETGDEEVLADVEVKDEKKQDNGDGTVTKITKYTDGSVVEETTLENGTIRKTTISPDGMERNTTETALNGYVTEVNSVVEEMDKTLKITTTVVARDDSGIIIAETIKEKVLDK